MNVTPELSSASKELIGLLMFIGRVGIFTIIYSLNTKNREKALYKYPEENVMVG
ncbi:K+ transporter Trk precursor [Leuconostoc citreum KM20]|uniref:K+ transporter Trk n=1 Tax=Leuconostoc citreum (strain KM20) TaxID=349519 RepID=B1MYU6_LEUCK|nr:K+ transporter Trk precursor [Leuconostoc citreum KM20]